MHYNTVYLHKAIAARCNVSSCRITCLVIILTLSLEHLILVHDTLVRLEAFVVSVVEGTKILKIEYNRIHWILDTYNRSDRAIP